MDFSRGWCSPRRWRMNSEMYVKEASTRKVRQITEQLCGTDISAAQVSRIAKLLDDELKTAAIRAATRRS